MKTKETAKKGLYVGVGGGLILFALIGLLPGSFIGGVIGLNIAGSIFGTPLEAALLPRIIVGISMVLGIMIAGLIFIVGCSLLGWLAGYVIDAVRYGRVSGPETALKTK
ncbi:MAG: hypothetical protein OHK0032_13110 [Thermodesulfovibrionales bacterium]